MGFYLVLPDKSARGNRGNIFHLFDILDDDDDDDDEVVNEIRQLNITGDKLNQIQTQIESLIANKNVSIIQQLLNLLHSGDFYMDLDLDLLEDDFPQVQGLCEIISHEYDENQDELRYFVVNPLVIDDIRSMIETIFYEKSEEYRILFDYYLQQLQNSNKIIGLSIIEEDYYPGVILYELQNSEKSYVVAVSYLFTRIMINDLQEILGDYDYLILVSIVQSVTEFSFDVLFEDMSQNKLDTVFISLKRYNDRILPITAPISYRSIDRSIRLYR